MTNAEKYLRDGVDVEFVDEFEKFCAKQTGNQASSVRLIQFLSRAVTPTLTEDERVILRNIHSSENYKTYKKIGRTTYGSVYLTYDLNKETAVELGELETDITELEMYNNLFQFIKNGEEYSIEELLKGE